jgi:hypothetical protein
MRLRIAVDSMHFRAGPYLAPAFLNLRVLFPIVDIANDGNDNLQSGKRVKISGCTWTRVTIVRPVNVPGSIFKRCIG